MAARTLEDVDREAAECKEELDAAKASLKQDPGNALLNEVVLVLRKQYTALVEKSTKMMQPPPQAAPGGAGVQGIIGPILPPAVREQVKHAVFVVTSGRQLVGNGCLLLFGQRKYAVTAYHVFSTHGISVEIGSMHLLFFPHGAQFDEHNCQQHLFAVHRAERDLDVLILRPEGECTLEALHIVQGPEETTPVFLAGYPFGAVDLPGAFNVRFAFYEGMVNQVGPELVAYSSKSFAGMSGTSVLVNGGQVVAIHTVTVNQVQVLELEEVGRSLRDAIEDLRRSVSSVSDNTNAVAVGVRADMLMRLVQE